MRRYLENPTAHLITFAVFEMIVLLAVVGAGAPISNDLMYVATYGWVFLLMLWVVADAKHRHRVPCYDFGFFVFYFFPVTIVWYCLWSRGWRGMLMLLFFVVLWFVPFAAALMAWELRHSRT